MAFEIVETFFTGRKIVSAKIWIKRGDIRERLILKIKKGWKKGYEKEFALYDAVSRLAPKIIADERQIYKGVSPNVDFYSGFAYSMLGLPVELYTPIFAIARIAGWSAHRLEEVAINGKIMRPAYKNIGEHKEYIPMEKRWPAGQRFLSAIVLS